MFDSVAFCKQNSRLLLITHTMTIALWGEREVENKCRDLSHLHAKMKKENIMNLFVNCVTQSKCEMFNPKLIPISFTQYFATHYWWSCPLIMQSSRLHSSSEMPRVSNGRAGLKLHVPIVWSQMTRSNRGYHCSRITFPLVPLSTHALLNLHRHFNEY